MRKALTWVALTPALFALCACTAQAPRVETVYVKVPVAVSCVKDVPKKPVFVVDQVKGDESLGEITDAYMVDRHQRRIYEKQLENVITGCVK